MSGWQVFGYGIIGTFILSALWMLREYWREVLMVMLAVFAIGGALLLVFGLAVGAIP